MSDHYGVPRKASVATKAFESTVNLLSFIFARIYFPTYSNRLKELASFADARRSLHESSGLQAIEWRYKWEDSADSKLKSKLIEYNRNDCIALKLVTSEVLNVITTSESRRDVDFAEAPKALRTNRAVDIYHAFNQVRRFARSDYSQSRIKLAATDSAHRKTANSGKARSRHPKWPTLPSVKGRIIRVPRKRKCERHLDQPSTLVPTRKFLERSLVDLAFSKAGCRKTVLRYVGKGGRCQQCGEIYVPPLFKEVKNRIYGPGFCVWIVYLRMVLRLSYRLIKQFTRDLFGVELSTTKAEEVTRQYANNYARTEELLHCRMLKSPAIHVDETKLNILGIQQYVWVLTDGNHVIFRLTEGRETGFLESLLANYQGTLVSDFYGGYDELPFWQQKCLVHLIRYLNDDLWKNPYNFEFEKFVASVRDLLLPILSDAQRFGQKAFHLRKHRHRVDSFFRNAINTRSEGQELILKYQKRFARYRESLFTFLERDGVPWNNNAAERALRHLAVQRKISCSFSSRGAQEYILLLGVAQSCRFQGKSFLGFLRSGMQDVDAYKGIAV